MFLPEVLRHVPAVGDDCVVLEGDDGAKAISYHRRQTHVHQRVTSGIHMFYLGLIHYHYPYRIT